MAEKYLDYERKQCESRDSVESGNGVDRNKALLVISKVTLNYPKPPGLRLLVTTGAAEIGLHKPRTEELSGSTFIVVKDWGQNMMVFIIIIIIIIIIITTIIIILIINQQQQPQYPVYRFTIILVLRQSKPCFENTENRTAQSAA
ncbi:unnamed protein product [Schistocephalus solidus]|uniref:Cadherin_C domain-containing protein n=1 Tax=Schistocephalus solidus TaxID=70667 RepID=A0A183SDH7_SCHSO|nr:unnamed protein product [Schistocephalus solidus]